MDPTNWIDDALVIAVLISALMGLRAGLARVVVGIAAALVGLVAAFWLYGVVGAKLAGLVHNVPAANFLGFFLIFTIVLVMGGVVAALLSRIFQWVGLSWFNHLLGGIAGALRGIVLMAGLVTLALAFAPSPLPDAASKSVLLPYATGVTEALISTAPRELKDAVTERAQNLREQWQEHLRNQDKARLRDRTHASQ